MDVPKTFGRIALGELSALIDAVEKLSAGRKLESKVIAIISAADGHDSPAVNAASLAASSPPDLLVSRLKMVQQTDDMRMINRAEVIDLVGDVDRRVAARQALLAYDPDDQRLTGSHPSFSCESNITHFKATCLGSPLGGFHFA